MRESTKKSHNEVVKIRYQLYRKAGYSSAVARGLSKRSLDVSAIELSKRTGKIKRNSTTRLFVERMTKSNRLVDDWSVKVNKVNHENYPTRWGMISHDRRFKGETGNVVTFLKNENHLSNDQAWYMAYIIQEYEIPYETAKTQLIGNNEFEIYHSKKRKKPR